jgi:CRP-like cAMP-binding protein
MSDIQRRSLRKLISRSRSQQPTPRAGREPHSTNRLLGGLPHVDERQLLALCERVQVQAGELLHEAGKPIRSVYFPTGSFASLLADTDRTNGVEVALIGAEGMLGLSCMLEVTTAPFQVRVQGAGSAWRMDVGEFQRQVAARPVLSQRLARYLFVRMTDLAQMVICTRYHLVETRLARWLLMTADRADSHEFHLTQELLAAMLGVRRAGITIAAGSLQERGFIRYHRGIITILDRRGLERVSCICYARARESYTRHLG